VINVCHYIEILEIIFEDDSESYLNLIENQKYLKEIKIISMNEHDSGNIIDSLSCQSHSLRILHFEDCVFKNAIPFKEMSLLQNLESLILINCDTVNTQNSRLDFSFPSLKKIHFETKIPFLKEIERLISHSKNLEEIFLFGLEKIRLTNIFKIIANNSTSKF